MDTKSVLIVNTGSSSLKWVVLNAATEATRQQGDAHWDGGESGRHQREVEAALEQVQRVDAVGHRVVHGGTRFQQAVVIDDSVQQDIDELSELAPLHNPAALAGIAAARARFPDVPQVAAFDTAFHANLPEAAHTYPLPWDWSSRWGLRRFGFHGLSVAYAVPRVRELLGESPARLVVCHLGAGCSVTAVAAGESVGTSMGFTPLEGLMMAQRSGSVDPGLLLYLLTRQGVSAEDLERALNERSGLLGVSGVSADLRKVLAAAEQGNVRARLARDMFVSSVISCVGGMIGTLGGVDGVVFTGGIGEHSAVIRSAVCRAFGYVGLRLDEGRNAATTSDGEVSGAASAVRAVVITAREDVSIARDVRRVLKW